MSLCTAALPALDLSADVTTLTAALCDIESVSHNEAALCDAIEAALRPLGAPRGAPASATRSSPAPTSGGPSGSCWPATSTRSRSTDGPAQPSHPARGRRTSSGRGTVDMKGGVAVQLEVAPGPRALARPHLRLLRGRGGRRPVQRPAGSSATPPTSSRRDFAVLARADRRPASRAAARARCASRSAPGASRPTRPGRGTGHNAIHEAGAILAPAHGIRAADRRRSTASSTARRSTPPASTAASPATSSRTGASSRSTTATRPSLSEAEAAAAHRASCSTASRWQSSTTPAGRGPGLHLPAAQSFVEALRRARCVAQGGLDRRGPLRRPRHRRRQLRPGRPQPRPPRRRALPRSRSWSRPRPRCCAGWRDVAWRRRD